MAAKFGCTTRLTFTQPTNFFPLLLSKPGHLSWSLFISPVEIKLYLINASWKQLFSIVFLPLEVSLFGPSSTNLKWSLSYPISPIMVYLFPLLPPKLTFLIKWFLLSMLQLFYPSFVKPTFLCLLYLLFVLLIFSVLLLIYSISFLNYPLAPLLVLMVSLPPCEKYSPFYIRTSYNDF